MNDTWKNVLWECKPLVVTIKKIVGRYNDSTDCIIAFDNVELYICVKNNELFAPIEEGDIVGMYIGFELDYYYTAQLGGFKSERKIKSLIPSGDGVNIVYKRFDDGVCPTSFADVAGKVLSIERIRTATVFKISCVGKEFPIVFYNGFPKATVGDILYGEYEVVAHVLNKNK